ncbi:PH domain-containing protein, partial [Streptomyces sp. G35A]
MSTPEPQSPAPEPSKSPVSSVAAAPPYKDRIHRSSAGIAGGVLMLAVIAWLGIDAVVAGEGSTPWLALATVLLVAPLVIAYTLRPAVHVNDDRLRVRNPFRVVVLPWGRVAALRSGFTNEVVAESGAKYQLWALPVSMRARKRASRAEARLTA